MSKFDYINKSLSEFTKNDKPEFRWRQSASQCGELRWKPSKIKELAKGFTNSTQMIDYRGENQLLINQAGRYIEHKKVDRPEWFDPIVKGNQETLEECLKILNNSCTTSDEIYADTNYIRLLNRLWTIFEIPQNEIQKLTPNVKWKRRVWGVNVEEDDNYIYNILCTYKNIPEMRNKKIHKTLITRVQTNKNKYPKSYEKYQTMLTQPGNKKGSKRGSYKK